MAKRKNVFKAPRTPPKTNSVATAAKAVSSTAKMPLARLTTKKASGIIIITGIVTFFTGIANPFQGDDRAQILDNIPVHSIANFFHFFNTGTFATSLSGSYFRPIMTVVFSIAYSISGPSPVLFHLIQISIAISSTVLLFLILRYSFGPMLSLVLALVWLVHPLDSQAVFAIPSMQDALFVFFGFLGVWLLLRMSSTRSLLLVAGCLLLSLLSKETGIVFVLISLLYLILFDPKRLKPFAAFALAAAALYGALRLHAVGLPGTKNPAPIDLLNVWGRMLSDPSIIRFYLTLLVFPVKLATGYYWVNKSFGWGMFIIPLIVDIAAVTLAIMLGVIIHHRATRAVFKTYVFFSIWTVLGLAIVMQVFPLDMTACEDWFYLPMAGLLGMAGTAIQVLLPTRILAARPKLIMGVVVIVLGLLALRTAVRGTEYSNALALSMRDATVSKEDYTAADWASLALGDQGRLVQATSYIDRSISIFPSAHNYTNLGWVRTKQGNYQGALDAYRTAYRMGVPDDGDKSVLLDGYGGVSLVHGNSAETENILLRGVENFPHDSALWVYLAMFYSREHNLSYARDSIIEAAKYGPITADLYNSIGNGQPFKAEINNELVSFP